MKTFRQHITEASLWDIIFRKNKGVFYRGIGKGGKTTGLGALGVGVYLTWVEGMAKAFADRMGSGGIVKKYKVKSGLKLCDDKHPDFVGVKEMMGFQPWEFSDDPMFAKMVTMELKKKRYNGVVSDNPAMGICIFNEKDVTEVK
jgi:hypothetical protein